MSTYNALGFQQRARSAATGYSRDTIAELERQRTLDRMNPQGAPVAANDIFSNAMERNNDAFRWDRINGGTGAPMIRRARELAPLNAAENMAGMDPTVRQSILDSPMPEPDTGEGRMRSRPSQPDPFAGGYQAKGRDDPYTTRPRKHFNEGGTIEGPGGPTDDMVPAVVDGVDPVWLSDGERVQKASTRDWLGEKFFVDLDKKADKERAEFEADKLRPKSRHRAYPMPVLDAETSMPIPGYAEGGTVLANNPDEQEFGLRRLATNPYGSGYSVTPMPLPVSQSQGLPIQSAPEPAFQPDPNVLASLRQRRRDLRAMPEMDQGQQPVMNVASPMDPPPMRRAPMTMTEKDRLNMPLRPSVTPQVDPDFEASLVGQSGMGKRRNRAAYLQEQALWNRDDQRQQITDARTGAKDEAKRAKDFEEWKTKRVIDSQFDQAARNEERGFQGNLLDQQQKEKAAREAMDSIEGIDFIESDRGFVPVVKTKGGAVKMSGSFMPNKESAPAHLTPTQIESLRKAGASIAIGPDGTRVTYTRAQPEKPATIKIFNDSGDIKDWPADYDPPTGWNQAYPKGKTPPASGPVAVTTQAEWSKLAPGTRYTTPDGKTGIKK